jgi:hypothetical protein
MGKWAGLLMANLDQRCRAGLDFRVDTAVAALSSSEVWPLSLLLASSADAPHCVAFAA